jgi:hypothetical protein
MHREMQSSAIAGRELLLLLARIGEPGILGHRHILDGTSTMDAIPLPYKNSGRLSLVKRPPGAAKIAYFVSERQLHSELDVSPSQSAFALGNRERTGAAAISAVAGEHIQG